MEDLLYHQDDRLDPLAVVLFKALQVLATEPAADSVPDRSNFVRGH